MLIIRLRRVGGKMIGKELSYLEKRAADERAAATSASDERVRRVHTDLAERYEEALTVMARQHRQMHRIIG